MKLIIFGCLAGTNPRPGRNHTALALEKDGVLHWFDAGENCSRTMYFMGYKAEQIKRLRIACDIIQAGIASIPVWYNDVLVDFLWESD